MDKNNSIEVRNLHKSFTVKTIHRKTDTSGTRKNLEKRTVLEGINFSIKKGESVGILGRNGSGKSTLLKMLSKVMYPDSGEIEVDGKIVSILELGMGFHREFSGRENIYLKGTMYGISEKEMDGMIDDIIAFSELGERIDDPVRVYSSGMYARLAFSIAIKIKCDIVIIDEILSVGDIGFRTKCSIALKDVKKRGTTIIMASHSMKTVEEMCDIVIWIDSGKVREVGESSAVCYHFEKDLVDSFDSVKTSAETGNLASQNSLGIFYRDGKNIEADSIEAIKWFKKAAESGHVEAQLNLAEMFLLENNTEENREKACFWFSKSADAGNTVARMRLAETQSNNKNSEIWKYAIDLLTKLAENGNTRAQITLGNALFNGIGTSKDYDSAFTWYQKAAEKRDNVAQYKVGMMYRDGQGTEKDLKKAVEWLSASANNNFTKAKVELAIMFRRGTTVERDLSKALEWYQQAANTGDANSMYQIAVMYRDGIGIDVNIPESNRWFDRFSKQERLKIQTALGDICRYDANVEESLMMDVYERTANDDSIVAEYTLGMFLKRKGQFEVASKMFKKAADREHVGAQIELGFLFLKGSGVEKNLERAFELFKKAADSGNQIARNQLGLMYRDGTGIEKNTEKAKEMFRLASEQGHNESLQYLLEMR